MKPPARRRAACSTVLALAASLGAAAEENPVQPAPVDLPRFEVFERAFTQQGKYGNPYVEVTATATFVQPGGRERSLPLFWDGGTEWNVRFSPDVVGAWRWSVRSTAKSA